VHVSLEFKLFLPFIINHIPRVACNSLASRTSGFSLSVEEKGLAYSEQSSKSRVVLPTAKHAGPSVEALWMIAQKCKMVCRDEFIDCSVCKSDFGESDCAVDRQLFVEGGLIGGNAWLRLVRTSLPGPG
jgi:hypothetical protein